MSYSLVLLAAGLAAGQTAAVAGNPGCATCAAANQQAVVSASVVEGDSIAPHSLFGRIRSLFHAQIQPGETAEPASVPVTQAGVPTTAEPPQAAGVEPAAYKPPMPEVKKQYKSQVGYGENYCWVTGQLFYLHTSEGSVWVVRYAAVDQVDPHGGSIVLTAGVDMKNYREGDLVCVEGEILADRAAPGRLRGAVYRPKMISMITRSDY